jgi:hypothetical protein
MIYKNRWINQYTLLEHNSNFHNKVRDIFITDPFFSGLKCYQEVLVCYLVEDYPNKSHRFDWYIEELNLIIELHGQQHYEVVTYGITSYEEAQRDFQQIQHRDQQKKQAAINACFKYKEISYKLYKKLTAALLKEKLLET